MINVDIQYGGMSSVLCCVVVRFDYFMVLFICFQIQFIKFSKNW